MDNTQTHTLRPDRNARLAKYCLAGAGTAILVGTVTTADAAVVYINFNNQVFTDTIPDDGSSSYFTSGTAGNFDFNGDGVIDFRLRQRLDSSIGNLAGFAATTTAAVNVVGLTAGGVNYPSRLAAGSLIGGTATFITIAAGGTGYLASVSGSPNSKWVSTTGTSGYVGVRFTAGANTYYGWVGLTVAGQSSATPYAITLSGIAYENVPNQAIRAGSLTSVPEPGSLALVALGGVGLAAYRRRRAAAPSDVPATEATVAE